MTRLLFNMIIGMAAFMVAGTTFAQGNPYDTAPAWSPDGQSIYFYSYRHGAAELYRMDPDGGHQTRLTETDHNEWWPFTTKDPDQIIVVSDRDSGGNFKGANLYLFHTVSKEMTQLTDAPEGFFAARADVARDANILMYAIGKGFRAPDVQLKVIDLSTLETTDYGDDPSHNNSNPSLSADGSVVAYSRKQGIESGVYLNNLSGQSERLLFTVHGEIPMVRLSPDGKWVAFSLGASARMAGEDGQRVGERDVFLASTNGQEFRRLTSTPGSDHGASWSPDGKTITFASYRHGPADIFAIGIDASSERNLTRTSVVGHSQ